MEVSRPGGLGGILQNAFNMDPDSPADYVEESTDAAGHHIKKTVHKGDGWQQVQIESDSPMNMGDVIGQIMQAQMEAAMERSKNMKGI